MSAHYKKYDLILPEACRFSSLWLLLIVAFMLSPFPSFSQGKQANNWYFGYHAGISFATGEPIALTNGELSTKEGCATISTPQGVLQFYTDGIRVYDRFHNQMPHGYGLTGHPSSTQSAIIVPIPGSITKYYIFTTDAAEELLEDGLRYSKVDMTLNNNKGDVVAGEKNVLLTTPVCEKLTAVLNSDGKSYWVISKIFANSDFHAYRVKTSGLQTVPVVSTTGPPIGYGISDYAMGYLKVSPDGKWLAMANTAMLTIGIYRFDNTFGVVNHVASDYLNPFSPYGVEFSPDSKQVYFSARYSTRIVQYDLSSEDSATIINSKIELTLHNSTPDSTAALQLGPDSRIYVARNSYNYLSRINYPNLRGNACGYEQNAVNLNGKSSAEGLPPFIVSFFQPLLVSTEHYCTGQPTIFTLQNPEGIDSLKWEFNDAGNAPYDTSTLFNPVYQFSHADTFYVKLTAWSEIGPRTIVDTVIIHESPVPNFGPDTLFCPDAAINLTLYAGPFGRYYWNGNPLPGNHTITISETGEYWVSVNNNGCIGRDTINVARYDEASVSVNPVITPSNCGQSNGSITGIEFTIPDPYTVLWLDAAGNQVGTGNNLLNVPAGAYYAEVTFGSNCTHEFGPYPITDNNATQIADVLPTPDHCSQGMGLLEVLPASGNPADYLYSLNGGPYQANDGVFTGLGEGEYHISLKDAAGCISNVYTRLIENIPGPEIHCFPSPATGSSSDGRITVISPNTGLTYQLVGGLPQTGNIFTGLTAQIYYVLVTDAFGCTARDTVEVESLQGSTLVALAGINRQCLNKPASSNIRLARVSGLKQFKATLYYNAGILNCTNFNSNEVDFPGITAQMFTAPARVEIAWNGSTAVTNTDTLLLGSLIFETTQPGLADINWEHGSPMTWFLNEAGDTIHQLALIPGNIQVHEIPEIGLQQPPPLCEGDNITLSPGVNGGTAPIQYAWTGPQGSSSAQQLTIPHVGSGDSGLYHFTVSDYFNCADTTQIMLSVVPLPQANFPTTTDTVYYEQQTQLQATPGYASYQWNTGDTTYFINITEEGDYSVLMQTTEGCSNLEKVTLIDTWFPFNIPNAFTPNGDGLNDTFRPVTDYDRFSKFSMVIYNSWGQKQFETTKPADGWNGKDAAAGVYVWVITYADYLGKVSMLRGSITVVR